MCLGEGTAPPPIPTEMSPKSTPQPSLWASHPRVPVTFLIANNSLCVWEEERWSPEAQMMPPHFRIRRELERGRTVVCQPTVGSEQRIWRAEAWVWAGQV